MKLIQCNGRDLTVRDVGPVVMRLHADAVPIKLNGTFVMMDDEARTKVRELLDTGLYKRTK